MNFRVPLLCLLLTAPLARAAESCYPEDAPLTAAIETLSLDVLAATDKLFTRVVSMKIRMAGSGDISILLNDAGEVEAVRINYQDGKDVRVLTVTAEELNRGQLLQLAGQEGKASPLRLSVKRPPGLNPATGGEFNLEIATDLAPLKLANYPVRLAKSGDAWVLNSAEGRVREVVIHPSVGLTGWRGTFTRVELK